MQKYWSSAKVLSRRDFHQAARRSMMETKTRVFHQNLTPSETNHDKALSNNLYLFYWSCSIYFLTLGAFMKILTIN